MWQKVLAILMVAIFLSFPDTGQAQQHNPFTAVLTAPITRPTVKIGRKRFTLKETGPQSIRTRTNNADTANKTRTDKADRAAKNKTKKRTDPNTGLQADLGKQVDKSNAAHHDTHQDQGATNGTTKPDQEAVRKDWSDAQVADLRRNIGIQYQILSEDAQGQLKIDDPDRLYHSGEVFRLRIQSNINANLYLLAEDARTGERRLLFPNYKYREGTQQIKALAPVTVPPLGEPAFEFDNMPGEERIIVICSRDEIPALQIERTQTTPNNALKLLTTGTVPPDIERAIENEEEAGSRDFIWVNKQSTNSATNPTTNPGVNNNHNNAGVYVVNTSPRDNEEVIYLIRLKHAD